MHPDRKTIGLVFCVLAAASLIGCQTPSAHRALGDKAAADRIATAQTSVGLAPEQIVIDSAAETLRQRLLLDRNLPRTSVNSLGLRSLPSSRYWEPTKHLAAPSSNAAPVSVATPLTLIQALQIAAANSRDFQDAKEALFTSALNLDLEEEAFRNTFAGMLSAEATADGSGDDDAVESSVGNTTFGVSRTLRNGIELTSSLMVDIAALLAQETASAVGLKVDASVSIPLLRGSGKLVAAEPLRQAQRNLVYAVHTFERFKRTFAVDVARDYLAVLQQRRELRNAEENYKRLQAATRRARRLADAGRLPEFQYDQAIQDALKARTRWLAARQSHASDHDAFKVRLGLPPDADIELSDVALDALQDLRAQQTSVPLATHTNTVITLNSALAQETAHVPPGRFELVPEDAIRTALSARLDLRTAEGRVEDAQRAVYVDADALRAELTLLGSAEMGERRNTASSATRGDAGLETSDGVISGLLTLDLPLERTAERIAYRKSLIALEAAVRDVQETEDAVKLAIRDDLRNLLRAREDLAIQVDAVRLAEKRVHSTDLLLKAGRAEIRDVLESEDALLAAQNALTAAMISYRINELSLQRDMGVLRVDAHGLWTEYTPGESNQ